MAPSRYDWKIVDWDVKPQHNQPILDHVNMLGFATGPVSPDLNHRYSSYTNHPKMVVANFILSLG